MNESRYASMPERVATTSRGATRVVFDTFRFQAAPSFGTYTVQLGDRWDTLAMRFFDDPHAWWALADLNPELFDPRSLRPGIVIRVP